MIQCCLCAVWHHSKCVDIRDNDQSGFWPCPGYRHIASDMQRNTITHVLETINATMRQLAKSSNTLEDQLLKQTRESERLLDDNVHLRQRLAQLSAENDSLRWKTFGDNNDKTLLIDDSLLQDVDDKKLLKSTEVEVDSPMSSNDCITAASSCAQALMTTAVTTRTKLRFARRTETPFSWSRRALLRNLT